MLLTVLVGFSVAIDAFVWVSATRVVASDPAFDPAPRRAATLAAAISVIGFLAVYAHAGLPEGPLRAIAWADLMARAPLR